MSRFRVQNPRAPKTGAARSKPRPSKAKTTAKSKPKETTKETKETAKATAAKASSAKGAAKTAKGAKKPPTDIPAQIDGLRGWADEIERKQGRMTYFGAAGLLIAIAASGAALYFGITAHNDSATKTDVDKIKQDIAALRTEVEKSNQSNQSLDQTITSLQQQLKSVQTKQAQTDQQISALQSKAATAAPSTLPTPGATAPTTTTP